MIIDASVLVAIVFEEDDAEHYLLKIDDARYPKISAPSMAEASIAVLRRKGYEDSLLIEALVMSLGIEVVPFTEEHAVLALSAYARFGRTMHRAQLNFGDCMTYALARASG